MRVMFDEQELLTRGAGEVDDAEQANRGRGFFGFEPTARDKQRRRMLKVRSPARPSVRALRKMNLDARTPPAAHCHRRRARPLEDGGDQPRVHRAQDEAGCACRFSRGGDGDRAHEHVHESGAWDPVRRCGNRAGDAPDVAERVCDRVYARQATKYAKKLLKKKTKDEKPPVEVEAPVFLEPTPQLDTVRACNQRRNSSLRSSLAPPPPHP